MKEECPLNRTCLVRNAIYKNKAISSGKTKYYVGAAEGKCKRWYYNYKISLINSKYKISTVISNYYWKVTDSVEEASTITKKKKKLAKSRPCNRDSKCCNLCLTEKLIILQWMGPWTLNERSELMATCWQKNKYLINIWLKTHI